MIILSEKIIDEIKAEGEKAYPNECCGFIFGKTDGEHKNADFVKPTENTAGESFHRFLITPRQMLEMEMFGVKKGVDIIGFYHSHPDCKATPSEYDTSHALPVYSYAIVSVIKGKADEIFSYELDKNNDYRNFILEEIKPKGE